MSFPHKVDIDWLSANGSPADVHLGHVLNHVIDQLELIADYFGKTEAFTPAESADDDSADDDGAESVKDADREPGTWQQRRRR